MKLLEGKRCVDCGESDPLVLEFDHRDGVKKELEIATMVGRRRWPKIDAEVATCDIRCANCHCRRTAQQFGWPKLALQREVIARATLTDDERLDTIEADAGVA